MGRGKQVKPKPNFDNPEDLQVVSALHCARVLAAVNGNKRLAALRLGGIAYHTLSRFLKLAREIEQYRTDFRRVLNTMSGEQDWSEWTGFTRGSSREKETKTLRQKGQT